MHTSVPSLSGCSRSMMSYAPPRRKLDELCAALEGSAQNDVAILKSLPGIGRINLAALLAEASGPLSRRDYPALRTLTGVAPVTKRSGKSCIVIMRYGAHARLRNTVYHWARVAVQHDPKCRSPYAALRQRGCSHGRAIRGVADRLLDVACVLLTPQTPFDPAYGEAVTSLRRSLTATRLASPAPSVISAA